VRWDIGAQAQRWSNGAVNNGLVITSSNETNSFGWRRFANGTSGGTAPSLVITYGSSNCTFYPQTGHSVCGAIRDHYNALGGPNGFLGYPTSDEITNPDGVGKRNTFQNANGHIYWSPATGAAEIGGAIFDHWGNFGYETGPLGYPTSDEIGTPNGAGRYNVFQNANDHIYWSPATGAQEIGGSIFTHWGDYGYEAGRLGFPTTDETGTPDGVGRYNHFQGSNGSIYFTPATGTHEIEGAIAAHWGQLGYETGVLGYPLSDETGVSDGVGRYNDFFKNASYAPGVSATANGSIYFNVTDGAHEVHGAIRTKYLDFGGPTGKTPGTPVSDLGYPISDQAANTGTGGYTSRGDEKNDFGFGTIYLKTGTGEVSASSWYAMKADGTTGPSLATMDAARVSSQSTVSPSSASTATPQRLSSQQSTAAAADKPPTGNERSVPPGGCPPGTDGNSVPLVYRCRNAFDSHKPDGSYYSVGLRYGFSNAYPNSELPGPTESTRKGFGLYHTNLDHNIGSHTVALIVADVPPSPVLDESNGKRIQYRLGEVYFTLNSQQLVDTFTVIVQTQADIYNQAPDTYDLGVVTAYCDVTAPNAQQKMGWCSPDHPPPYNGDADINELPN